MNSQYLNYNLMNYQYCYFQSQKFIEIDSNIGKIVKKE